MSNRVYKRWDPKLKSGTSIVLKVSSHGPISVPVSLAMELRFPLPVTWRLVRPINLSEATPSSISGLKPAEESAAHPNGDLLPAVAGGN